MNEFMAAAHRRIARQLTESAAKEPSLGMRRDLEAQALHFTLLAEVMEGVGKPSDLE